MTSTVIYRTIDALVSVDQHEVFVRSIEPRAAVAERAIVLLHEGLGSVAMWKGFPERLARRTGRRVIAYDRPGYGRTRTSIPSGTIDFENEECELLAKLMARLVVERPILFGHSDGATLALMAAKDLGSAVVAEAPHVVIEPAMLAGIERACDAWETQSLRNRIASYHDGNVDLVFHRWVASWRRYVSMRWSMTETLERLTVPVFALQGDRDHYASAVHLGLIAERCRGPVKTTLLQDCGHVPHMEQPETVLAQTQLFLGGHVA